MTHPGPKWTIDSETGRLRDVLLCAPPDFYEWIPTNNIARRDRRRADPARSAPHRGRVASAFRRELSPDLNAMQMVVLVLTIAIVALTEVYWRLRTTRP